MCPGNAEVEPDDASLARGARQGDLGCFDVLVRRYEGRLVRFLHQRTGNRQEAEDIAQTAFVAAYRNIGRFDLERPFAPWLFAIASRQAIDAFRARRKVECFEEAAIVTRREPVVDDEQSERLWRLARGSMSASSFTALWLRYVEMMRVKEVAGVMGRSAVHVRVLLHRGRAALGAALMQCDEPWAFELRPGKKWEL